MTMVLEATQRRQSDFAHCGEKCSPNQIEAMGLSVEGPSPCRPIELTATAERLDAIVLHQSTTMRASREVMRSLIPMCRTALTKDQVAYNGAKKDTTLEKLDEFQSTYENNKHVYNKCIPLRDSIRAAIGPSIKATQVFTHANELSQISDAITALRALRDPTNPL